VLEGASGKRTLSQVQSSRRRARLVRDYPAVEFRDDKNAHRQNSRGSIVDCSLGNDPCITRVQRVRKQDP
jgi:hypothetical protein